MNKTLLSLSICSTLVAGLSTSQAALTMLSDPTAATSSPWFTGAGGFPVEKLYDGTSTDTWVTGTVGTAAQRGGDYAGESDGGNGAPPLSHTVVFDMGSTVDVGGLYLAQRIIAGPGGTTETLDVYFGATSTDQTAALALVAANTPDYSLNALDAPNSGELTEFDFGSNTSAQYITFVFHGQQDSIANGASELILGTHVAVPEPSSTALLGLGGLALVIRRRR